jgi:hypothetical protein
LLGKNCREKYITERNEEAPENGKELSHCAHANEMNEQLRTSLPENPADIGR